MAEYASTQTQTSATPWQERYPGQTNEAEAEATREAEAEVTRAARKRAKRQAYSERQRARSLLSLAVMRWHTRRKVWTVPLPTMLLPPAEAVPKQALAAPTAIPHPLPPPRPLPQAGPFYLSDKVLTMHPRQALAVQRSRERSAAPGRATYGSSQQHRQRAYQGGAVEKPAPPSASPPYPSQAPSSTPPHRSPQQLPLSRGIQRGGAQGGDTERPTAPLGEG